MDAYERESIRLQALYDEVPTPDVSEESESEDEGAQDIISEHDTDTEQEEPDEDGNQSDTFSTTSRSLYFYGGDGTKWKKHAPGQRVRTRQQDTVTQLPGVRAGARNANTPIQCWMLFFEEILDTVIENTNLYIQKIAPRYKNKYDVVLTNKVEMKAFIGLLYLAGSQHGGRKKLYEFWSEQGLGLQLFPASLSQRRFMFLMKCIRFDNTDTRDERKKLDTFAAVRDIFEKFNEQCKKTL